MSSDGSVEIDESRFPLVIVSFRGAVRDEVFRDYLERMTALVTRGEKNVVIMDAREAGRTPPIQRKMQAEWLDANRRELSRNSLGTAFVITSAFVRGVLTAIFWLTSMPSAHTVVKTYAEAEDWAFARLREAGLEPPLRRG
jgi:hypothetical protein